MKKCTNFVLKGLVDMLQDDRALVALIVFCVSVFVGLGGLILGIYVENNRIYNKCTSEVKNMTYTEVVDICKRAVK